MMNENVFLDGTPTVGFGAFDTSPQDTRDRLADGFSVATSVLIAGGIGAGIGYAFSKPSNRYRYQRNGAIAGAVVGGGAVSLVASAPILCGLFSSETEKKEIEQAQRPIRALVTSGAVAAGLAAGALGATASKKHPLVGRLIGAAVGSGAVVTAFAATECPKLSINRGTT